jgi:signal transduction histidine kinase
MPTGTTSPRRTGLQHEVLHPMPDAIALFAAASTTSDEHDSRNAPTLEHRPELAELCRLLPVPVLIVDAADTVVVANAALLRLAELPADADLTGTTAKPERLRDLGLVTHPLNVAGESCRLLTMAAPNEPADRSGLEASFLHDLLNTASGVRGLTGILQEAEPWEVPRITAAAHGMADQLVGEITAWRDLRAAEDGDLVPQPRAFAVAEALHAVGIRYERHPARRDRGIVVTAGEAGAVTADPVILGRVLDNLVKNALEATPPGGTVTLGADRGDGGIRFWVHNPGEIPAPVRPRIFERAFSTRGRGRGMGTYSVKMLTESYLRGRVAFTSDAARGTTFTVTLPSDGI